MLTTPPFHRRRPHPWHGQRAARTRSSREASWYLYYNQFSMKVAEPPYPASWVNRFTSWMRGLPTPAWVSYLALFVLFGGILGVLSRWIAGIVPTGAWTIPVYYDVYSGTIITVATLAFYHYFEVEMAEALDQSKSLTKYSSEKLEKIKYEFINMPALPYLIASIFFALITIPAIFFEYGFTGVNLSNILVFVEWFLTAAVTFGFVLRLIRFILQIRRFYADLSDLSLYNLASIYELPNVAAQAGLVLFVLWYVNLPFTTNEFNASNPLIILTIVFISLVPLAAFGIPFGALNRRLVREKKEEINQVSLQIKAAFDKVDSDFEAGKLNNMENMEAVISNLMSKSKFLEAIPTWPWRQGTFRLTITAVLLPISVWLIQQLLDRLIQF